MTDVIGTFSQYYVLEDGSHRIHLKVVSNGSGDVLYSEVTVSATAKAVTKDALAKWNERYPGVDVSFNGRVVPDSELESLPESDNMDNIMDAFGL